MCSENDLSVRWDKVEMNDGYLSPEGSLLITEHVFKTDSQNTSSKLLISFSEIFHLKYKQLVNKVLALSISPVHLS